MSQPPAWLWATGGISVAVLSAVTEEDLLGGILCNPGVFSSCLIACTFKRP